MAYVPSQQTPEEQQNLFGLKSPTTSNPIPPQSGGSSGATSQSGNPVAPGQASSTQFGSNAAKLSDYLNANKEQAESFGNQVAGNLTQGYNQAMGAIDTGFGNFNTKVGASYTPPNQATVDQAAANPTDFASKPENVSAFQNLYNDQYKGPQNFESTQPYSDINAQVNKAVSDADLTNTPGGLGTYLNTYMGANDTTPGMQALDTALLMGNQNSRSAINQAAAPYSKLTGYLGQKAGEADTNVANAKNTANQTRADVQNRFTGQGGVIPTWENEFGQNLANTQNSLQTSSDQAKADFIAGKATPEELSSMGMSPTDYQQWLNIQRNMTTDYKTNINLGDYLTEGSPSVMVNSANFASQDDYSKAAALSKLTGADLGSFLNQDNSSAAGTAPKSLLSLNGTPQDQIRAADQSTLEQYPMTGQVQAMSQEQINMLSNVFLRNFDQLNTQQRNWVMRTTGYTPPGTPSTGTVSSGPSSPGMPTAPPVSSSV